MRTGLAKPPKSAVGVKSGASKKSRKSAQGSPLPEDRSPISAYPVGCCVLVESPVDDGGSVEAHWHMLVYRIARSPSPHCRRMSISPRDLRWNAGLGSARELASSTVVHASCWPERPPPEEMTGQERDPLADFEDAGSLMLSHLRAGGTP